MFTWDYNIYLGNESDKLIIDFISNDRFFLIVEIHDSVDKEELKTQLTKTKEAILSESVRDLTSFESTLDNSLKDITDSSKLSIAAALSIDDVQYLVTRGNGEIYIARNTALQKLITGDTSSSGFLQEGDFFILTTKNFSKKVKQEELKKLVFRNKPQDLVETLTPDLKASDDAGIIALFAQYNQIEDDEETEEATAAVESDAVSDRDSEQVSQQPTLQKTSGEQEVSLSDYDTNQTSRFNWKQYINRLKNSSSKGRKVTFVILIVLIIVFVWSVVLGNQRRQRNNFIEKLQEQTSVVEGKLDEADEVSGLNIQKSLELLKESQAIYDELSVEAEGKSLSELEELAALKQKIDEAEDSLKKEEQGEYSEFYDLNLIEKGAQAIQLYSDGETLAMLDVKNGAVYLLSIEQKSVDTIVGDKIGNALFIALHNRNPFIYGDDIGVIQFEDGDESVEIEPDDDLGSIRDMWMFNGNIYLLDAGNDKVYKYLVAEEGYSEKTSYFQSGQAQDLAEATAMAIDGFVYLAIGDDVAKYGSGLANGFDMSIPDEDVIDFEDMFADENTNDVYVLDKDSGRIFIFDKEGEFDSQVSASILKDADDFIVDSNEGILVLVKDKIYSLE